jgi:excisionase family DNA binding protein
MDLAEARKLLRRTAPPGLLRISEAAAVAGVHPETLRRRVRKGELPAWGSPRRVRREDVLKQFIPADMREVVECSKNLDADRE